jgi:hypothetical protein
MVLGKKNIVRQMAVAVARIFLLQAIEKKHLVRALVLGLDAAAWLQVEQLMDMPGHGFRNIDPPRCPERLHEPRGVDRVAPDVEGHPAVADHAGNDRSGMDADAQLQGMFSDRFTSCAQLIELHPHFERRQANIDRVSPVRR